MTIKELRCSKCGKKLFDYSDNAEVYGKIIIEIRCPRCKEDNRVEFEIED